MMRRYDVRLGIPWSSTIRITCAIPATVGTTMAFDALAFSIVTRGGG